MSPPRSLLERFRQWLHAPMDVQLVIEIAADYVAALRRQNGRVQSWALLELPAGTVRPAPLAENVADSASLQRALVQVAESVGGKQSRCALVVPDLVARAALLDLEQLPGRSEQAEGLLRWRLKKDVPFDVNHAALSYYLQPGRATTHEALVVVALRDLVQQYEKCLEQIGLYCGQVTLSSLAVLPCLGSSGDTPRLLVKRDKVSLSLAIVHGETVRLFRCLPLPAGSVETSGEALFEKIYPAVVYFQDQWNQSVGEIVISGLEQLRPRLAERLEKDAGCRVVEIRAADYDLPPSHLPGSEPDYRMLPCIGWFQGEGR